jgi:hypothetical protein
MVAGPFVFAVILVIFCASQAYWILRARALGRRLIRARTARWVVAAIACGVYLVLIVFNFRWFGRRPTPTHMTLAEGVLAAPFQWWVLSSMAAFVIAVLCRGAGRLVRGAARGLRTLFARSPHRESNASPPSPARRQFLGQTATAAVALPFVAGGYGLLYGRLNLETTEKRIPLARLPRAFEGFRIVQLSDIHIGPFMSEAEIRKVVQIANALKPDLAVLTGDFLIWDPATQQAVVNALAGLRAPFGVFGCLGNHEAWSRSETSIARLFEQAGIRMLRQARVPITTQGEALNLIGVDFETRLRWRDRPGGGHVVRRYLEGVEPLVAPDTVNILLSHNPNTFDRAADLGIDLSLAGHTHGGQVALEFVSPEISPARLITPYVAGWFQKPGGQLYVNRGIGTIGFPIRLGAPPEITVLELVRKA